MAPSLPKTYKAAIFKEANAPLALEDVELRQPEEGQILIKVLATGVCHSDAGVQAGAMMNTLYFIRQDYQFPVYLDLTLTFQSTYSRPRIDRRSRSIRSWREEVEGWRSRWSRLAWRA